MGTELVNQYESHKARQLRISQAAYRDFSSIKPRGVEFDTILRGVCIHYNARPEDILSNRRIHNISLPRHILIYLLCKMTKFSTQQIALKVDRDASTVLYAFKKIEQNIKMHQRDLDILEPKIRPLMPAW